MAALNRMICFMVIISLLSGLFFFHTDNFMCSKVYAQEGEDLLLAYEPFDSNGQIPLNGTTSGLGWAMPWDVQYGNDDPTGYSIASSQSLRYNALETRGGHAVGGIDWTKAGRFLDNSYTGLLSDYVVDGFIGKPGKELWLSFLIRKDKNTYEAPVISLGRTGVAWWEGTENGEKPVVFGYFGENSNLNGNKYWTLRVGADYYLTNKEVKVGQTVFVVMKLTFNQTGGNICLFINPDIGNNSPVQQPDVCLEVTSSLTFKAFTWYAGPGKNESSLDEIRFGTTYKAVTPAKEGTEPTISPEPTPTNQPPAGGESDDSLYNFENGKTHGFSKRWGNGSAVVSVDTSRKYAGQSSLKVDYDISAGEVAVGLIGNLPAIPKNDNVKFRVYVPQDVDVDIQAMLFGTNEVGQWQYNGDYKHSENILKNQWTEFTVKFENGNTPPASLVVAIKPVANSSHTTNVGTIWIDSITYEGYTPVPTPAPTPIPSPGSWRGTLPSPVPVKLLDDNFETGSQAWSKIGNVDYSIETIDGTKAIKVINTGWDKNYVEKIIPAQRGKITLEYRFKDTMPGTGSEITLRQKSTDKIAVAIRQFFGLNTGLNDTADENPGKKFLTAYTENTWCTVKVEADTWTKKYDVYINGNKAGDSIPFVDEDVFAIDTVTIGHISWASTLNEGLGGSALATYVDDIKITGEYKWNSAAGNNLSGLADWATELPFKDLFKVARTWQSSDGKSLDLDANGWVKSLQQGQKAFTYLAIVDGHYDAGKYYVLYDGEGEIRVGEDASIIHSESHPGRLVLNVEPNPNRNGIYLEIASTNPDNYIRNIRVVHEKYLDNYEQNPWHESILALWQNFPVFRFMDMMATNNNPIVSWSQRTTPQYYTQANEKGAAVEYLVDLANRTMTDAWFCMPHAADDDYIRNFAQFIKDNINPNLMVYVEYTNEAWHPGFEAGRYCKQKGNELGFGGFDYESQLRYYAKRSVEIFKIWEEVFAEESNRLVKVVSTNPDEWVSKTVLDYTVDGKKVYKYADALAIAPYMGLENNDYLTTGTNAKNSLEDVFADLTNNIQYWFQQLPKVKTVANERGVHLITYEAGQHLMPWGNESITPLFIAANRDPRMGDLYIQYLDMLKQSGVELIANFSSISRYSKWGCWGLLEYRDQDPATSPKYVAVQNWIADNPRTFGLLKRWESEPVLPPRPPRENGNAVKVPTPVTIDGELNEAWWNNCQEYVVAKKIIGDTDNQVSFKLALDDSNLYIAVKVKDDNLVKESENPWEDDSVEIYVDIENNGGGYDRNDIQIVKAVLNDAIWTNKGQKQGLQHAFKQTQDGYIMEFALAWTMFEFTPTEGAKIGLDIGNNDDDNGGAREGQILWSGTKDNWKDTTSFGEVELIPQQTTEPSSTPEPTPEPEPTPTPTPEPTPTPTPGSAHKPVVETVKAKAELDVTSSKLSVQVETKTIETALQKISEAKKEDKPAVVEIKADISSGAGEQIKEAEIKIPKTAVEKISQTETTSLKIDAGAATIKFDEKAVSVINSSANNDIVVTVKKLDANVLSDDIKQKVEDRPIYQFEVIASDSRISDFKGGNAQVELPYTLKEGEDPAAIIVYYIDAGNNLKVVRGRYNENSRTVVFTTTHFSKYAVGYNKVSFKDVQENAWYNKAVSFAAAREIVKGVGEQKFAPEANVKRADFLIMVMKAYGIQPDSSITENFSDAGSKYYTPYLATAKKLGLVTGVGNNRFAPEAVITRQDMMVILYRMLEKLGELPSTNIGNSGKNIASFKDASDVSEYAKQIIDKFIQAGIVSGDGNKINPKATSTRAQAVQLLYNLLNK